MSWFRWLDPIWVRRIRSNGTPLRGRVHRVSIVQGGEVSVVLRFGIDEPRGRELNQGALIEITPFEVPTKKPQP